MRILVLLAFAIIAFGEDPALDVSLPLVPEAAPDEGDEKDGRIVVDLTRDGRIAVRGERVTLLKLTQGLRDAKREYRRRSALRAKPGEGSSVTQTRARAPYVLLRADAEAPWGHVEWIQTIVAEQKYYCLWYATLRRADEVEQFGKVLVSLPAYRDDEPPRSEPTNELKLTVLIKAEQERPAPWGPAEKRTEVPQPTRFTYQVGSEPTRDLATARKRVIDFCKGVDHLKPTPDTIVVADIRASDKVHCGYAIAFAALLKAQGIEHVEVFGLSNAPFAALRLDHLPYPTTNDVPAGTRVRLGMGGGLRKRDPNEPR